MADYIKKNYEEILNGIRATVGQGALASPIPRLIAVSKNQPWERVNALLEAGQRVFGENRYQEAVERWSRIRDSGFRIQNIESTPPMQSDIINKATTAHHPDPNPESRIPNPPLELHYIGPLQTNKAPEVVGFFDCIHSVDRPKLADALAKAMAQQGKQVPCYIQVNTGEESQKAGVMPAEAAAFIHYCRDELKLPVMGLMCIPPVDVNPAPHFAFLRQLAHQHGLARLSMGMSSDWEIALRMGATDIRVGSALFSG